MNKKITSALILLISVSFGYIVGIGTFPCYSTEDMTKDIAMTSSEYSRIVWYRDTIVYETVRKRYLSVPNYHSLSAVSMYMANVYDYIPANYDFRTCFAELFGGSAGYICGKEKILTQIQAFVKAEEAMRR